ncbi:hypothetical protein CRM22_009965 [Opisthorchis felineus]|uniref:Uncharacterized protein n=1 Tax=Opisthorchis felineus TaxID=147828 RepID=A0A4S2L4N7_OPIFE|nr:hypothetical protein CRM22_009965 [Opisthorchis felineus]
MVNGFDRQLQLEVTKFTKLCKEKQEQLLASCAREEKRIKDDYEEQMMALNKKHRKQQEHLRRKLEYRRKALHRKLEHELRVELKLYRRYMGVRAQSTGRLNAESTSSATSLCSLDNTGVSRPDQNTTSTNQMTANQSTAQLNGNERDEQRRRKWIRRHLTTAKGTDSSELLHQREFTSTLKRLEKEMEDRLRFADDEARMAVAQMEWEFMRERHELKREYTEAMADFKQRRLSSLGQIKVCQVKGYFDIHRKLLIEEQTRELNARQRTSQDSLKRLAASQEIERQTACRLARTTAKGQKQVSQVLYAVKPKEQKLIERTASASGDKEISQTPRPMSAEATLIDRLYPKPEDEAFRQDNSSQSSTQIYRPISLYSSMGTGTNGVEVRAQSSQSIPAHCDQDNSHTADSTSSSKRLLPKSIQGRLLLRQDLRHSRSVLSIHSALDTCEHMQRVVINTLSKQQVDQWTDVLNQERALTEALMHAHSEQKKMLIEEETATLRRAQAEQESRAGHLAVVLEATEKFMENEFTNERNRLTAYYYGDPPMQTHSLHVETREGTTPDFNSIRRDDAAPHASPSLQSTLDYYPVGRRIDKSVSVSDRMSLKSGTSESTRGRVIICREENAA